ncbi:hypothetical protein THER5_0105 [Bifidobacterium thermacidophilum subsp. thermacidophilum]|uniref:Uncharacterized protein n=1 Tax=Bifidobacterium thermacidophilum subsp. thermacidophilum TaxID=79262 RepID=A0A087E2C5_9BIFI|nr:hypothetical protein THER5_0105 [Bifidobacterium thermacidophilum subsp. thermacidophilum]
MKRIFSIRNITDHARCCHFGRPALGDYSARAGRCVSRDSYCHLQAEQYGGFQPTGPHCVNESSHDDARNLPGTSSRPWNRSLCEPELTQSPSDAVTQQTAASQTVIV